MIVDSGLQSVDNPRSLEESVLGRILRAGKNDDMREHSSGGGKMDWVLAHLWVMLLVGGSVLYFSSWYWHWPRIFEALSEAVFIAGLVAIAIDRPLKEHLVKDATRDIFVHMLGFSLPPEVRQKLHDIVFKTQLYIPEKHVRCTIARLDADRVELKLVERYQVRNPTEKTLRYEHSIAFEQSEHPHSVELLAASPKNGPEQKLTELKPDQDEPDLLRVGPMNIEIPSGSAPWFQRHYSLTRPLEGAQEFFQILPTMRIHLELLHDEDVNANAGKPDKRIGKVFMYEQVRMVGEKVTVRWRPQ